NEGNKKYKVAVYNPENKTEPIITVAEAPRTIAIDENAAEVKWMGDFIASAVDADGIDVSANVTADISGLDTTTPGEYDVLLTVTDFAGNVGTLTITVTVAKAE
ncbi:MAG: hypothetical protein JW708_10965, partial [Vallitaleaceae bacterium]|nr:hypothetical protein [Vallitaleaceae bacterium]